MRSERRRHGLAVAGVASATPAGKTPPDQLRKMGARIRVQGNEAVICGVKTLHGAAVQAQELRGGASLILAALGAKGVTVLEGYSFVQRGYEHICQDLNALGAAVKRIQE